MSKRNGQLENNSIRSNTVQIAKKIIKDKSPTNPASQRDRSSGCDEGKGRGSNNRICDEDTL